MIKVLIAEDDPHVRSLVSDVVKDLGHSATCANNGTEALAAFNDAGADVVVSDWMMPRMDGVELCRCLRSRLGAPYTYFILLTALDDPAHRLAGMQAGADDYLAKPFDIGAIEARLIAAERVTQLHRRREALLRLVRRFAAETDPNHLLRELLREAVELVNGSAGVVSRWDPDQQLLVPLERIPKFAKSGRAMRLRLGEGASGRAAELRAPVFVRRSDEEPVDAALARPQKEPADPALARTDNGPADPALARRPNARAHPALARTDMDSAIAVPLVHEARLVGALAIGRVDPEKSFDQEDAELLELLASTAAAALVALERARLDGVLLAARTAQHELNNQLAVARGYAEMLVGSPELPRHLHEMAEEVMHAADDAADIVRQMRNISQIREDHWGEPDDTTINLARSQQH